MIERDLQLSEAYRDADHPAPSPALDAAILDAARRAVATPPRRRWFAWAAPLATTAVLVLGLSLLFNLQREAPETLREAAPPPPQAASEAAPPAPSAATADSAKKSAPTAQAKAPVPVDRPSVAKPGTGESAPIPATAAAARESASQEAYAHAGATPEPRPFPAEVAAVPQPAPASAPPAAAKASADLAERREAAAAPARAAPAASPGMARLKAVSPAVEGPEPWLERIRQLVKEGRPEEARKSLEEWRRRYPEWAVPEDLKGLVISGGGR